MRQELASAEQRAWEKDCSRAITSDVIWKLDVYRAALFFLHLRRAAGSVSANLAEGYSRSTRADRLRFLGFALGSARECVSWYQAAREVLPDEAIEARLHLLSRIRALLLGLIRSLRQPKSASGHFEP